MSLFTREWNPYAGLSGYGAAQWTDYAPPATWAGLGGPGGYGSTAAAFAAFGLWASAAMGFGAWMFARWGNRRSLSRWIAYPAAGVLGWWSIRNALQFAVATPMVSEYEKTMTPQTPIIPPIIPAVPGA